MSSEIASSVRNLKDLTYVHTKRFYLLKKKKGRVHFNFREIGEESLQQVNNGSVAFRYFLGNVRFCEIIFFQYLALLH